MFTGSRGAPAAGLPAVPETDRERQFALLASLARSTYGRTFEPRCGDGELTALLARRCAQVVATDERREQVLLARRRCALLGNVHVSLAELAQGPPPGRYDLMVLNDVGFECSPMALSQMASRLAAYLQPAGELIAVHGLDPAPGSRLHGDAIHCLLGANLPLEWTGGSRFAEFRIDRWERLGRMA
jgi:SAM-dependent methyltransferase